MSQIEMSNLKNLSSFEANQSERCCVSMISSHDLIAEGISQGLEQHESIFLQDIFDDISDLSLNPARTSCYEVVLINARLMQYPLSDFFQQLLLQAPQARFIVFAADTDHQFLKSLMRVGVFGFVPMNSSVNELCNAILSVKSGKLWFEKSLLDEVIFDAMEFERLIEQSIKDRIGVIKEQMTNRESDVFCLVLEGLSTRDIAKQIHMSEPTVKQHLTSLFKKFDVSNRSQLILSAFEKVCPVTNMIKLFRRTLDQRRIESGSIPLIRDPLQ